MKPYLSFCLAFVLAACASSQPAPAVFDLGRPPAAAPAQPVNVQLLDVTAPPWLAGPGLAYRLDYSEPLRRQIYRDSRWAAPPAALLAERLRQRAAASGGTGKPVMLRLELEEFGQVFDAPGKSRVLLRLRAWREGQPAPRVFAADLPATSADAAGAAQALARAADAVVDQLLAWAATPP